MVNFDPNISQSPAGLNNTAGSVKNNSGVSGSGDGFSKTANSVSDFMSKVNDSQENADVSIMDLLSGRNEDINTVVAQVAKADMSFKVLVGVRNKLIEAYKQTMNMPV